MNAQANAPTVLNRGGGKRNERMVPVQVIGASYNERRPEEGVEYATKDDWPVMQWRKGQRLEVPESVLKASKGVLRALDEPAPGVRVPGVTDVDGIGRKAAERLEAAGIPNLPKLANATAPQVAAALGCSEKVALEHIEQAQALWKETLSKDVEYVPPTQRELPADVPVRKVTDAVGGKHAERAPTSNDARDPAGDGDEDLAEQERRLNEARESQKRAPALGRKG